MYFQHGNILKCENMLRCICIPLDLWLVFAQNIYISTHRIKIRKPAL